MSSSKSRCSFCGKKGSVRACNGCHQVAYCSKKCRKKGWAKGHREFCKSGQQPKQSTPSVSEGYTIPKGHPAAEARTFRVTELPVDLSKLDINYVQATSGEDDSEIDSDEAAGHVEAPVSKDSIGKVEPAISMNSVGNAETPRSMECKGNKHLLENSNTTNFNEEKKQADKDGEKDICFVCNSRHSVKVCSRCKGISYCSKACQKRDWGRHKQECTTVEDNIETKEYKKQQAQSRSSRADGIGPGPGVFNPFEFFPFSFSGLHPGMPMGASGKATPNTPFSAVNTMVRNMHPLKQIIDDFNDLPGEFFGRRPPPTNRILLAFITDFYPHILRHGIMIRDKKGEETHVLFYLDHDNPLPFFTWNDIRPGFYICFEEAFFHVFMDGTVGLRIEDASTVTIMRVK